MPGKAYYVTYPGYKAKSGINIGNDEISIPTGHAGVILVDDKGGTRYYEYGRYGASDPKRVGVASENGKGMIRRLSIPDARDGNMQPIVNALQKYETQNEGGRIQLTEIPDVDYNSAVKYAESVARDSSRKGYALLGNNCATFAHDVIHAGNKKVGSNFLTIRPVSFPWMYKRRGYKTVDYKKYGGLFQSLQNFLIPRLIRIERP